MSHYNTSINRVKLLFIKTTLSKLDYIAAENLILIHQLWHYDLNINNLSENHNSNSSTT